MKKLLSLAAAFLLCAGVQAQIVSSRSVSIKSAQKQPSETQWFLRGGLNVMKMTGDGAEDTGSKLGYNFVYGFQKPLGSVGTYWGMEFGLGSRGWKVEENEYSLSLMATTYRFLRLLSDINTTLRMLWQSTHISALT